MPVRPLYCDESGYTGSNLLDPDQPIFAIASTDLDDAAARAILSECFPRYQAREFKFPTVCGSKRNRADLVRLGRALEGMSNRIFIWIMDKRFVVLTKRDRPKGGGSGRSAERTSGPALRDSRGLHRRPILTPPCQQNPP